MFPLIGITFSEKRDSGSPSPRRHTVRWWLSNMAPQWRRP